MDERLAGVLLVAGAIFGTFVVLTTAIARSWRLIPEGFGRRLGLGWHPERHRVSNALGAGAFVVAGQWVMALSLMDPERHAPAVGGNLVAAVELAAAALWLVVLWRHRRRDGAS